MQAVEGGHFEICGLVQEGFGRAEGRVVQDGVGDLNVVTPSHKAGQQSHQELGVHEHAGLERVLLYHRYIPD